MDSGAETDNTTPPKPAPTADADSAEVEASLDVARIPPWATCEVRRRMIDVQSKLTFSVKDFDGHSGKRACASFEGESVVKETFAQTMVHEPTALGFGWRQYNEAG